MGLKRELNFFDAVSLELGAIIGAGIFVILGLAIGMAGPAVVVSILIGGIIAYFTAMSFGELGRVIPKEGGGYEFAHEIISPLAGFLTGWVWLFSNTVAGAPIALGFASYFVLLFPVASPQTVAVGAIVIVVLLNIFGVRKSATVNDILVMAKVAALLLFIGMGIPQIDWTRFANFAPFGLTGVLEGAAFMFFAYVGFAKITAVGEEVKNPKVTIPKSISIAITLSVLLYLLVSLTAVGLVDYRELAASRSPLADAMGALGGALGPLAIDLGALAATASVLLTSMLGVSRVTFAMSRHKEFPGFLKTIHPRFGTPWVAILTMGAIMAVLVTFGEFKQIVAISSFAAILFYLSANFSSLLLKHKFPKVKYSVPHPWYPLIGVISCTLLLFYLTPEAWIWGLGVTLLGVAVYKAESIFSRGTRTH